MRYKGNASGNACDTAEKEIKRNFPSPYRWFECGKTVVTATPFNLRMFRLRCIGGNRGLAGDALDFLETLLGSFSARMRSGTQCRISFKQELSYSDRSSQSKRRTHDRNQDASRHKRRCPCALQVNRRQFGSRRKIVVLCLAKNHKECVNAANACLSGIVQLRVVVASLLQFGYTLFCTVM